MPPFVLFSFALAEACAGWYSIDDPVMGGLSSSRVECREGAMAFTGRVSLENNGGFASIRSAAGRHDLRGYEGIELRVDGDGKTYKLNVRTDAGFDGIQYQTSFRAPPGWHDVQIPFAAFEPRFRGRLVRDAPPLDPARIVSFGFLISDRQEGPFALRVEQIGAYR
jgi:monofunctional biosynthetic peptidoglycan transglycosylase